VKSIVLALRPTPFRCLGYFAVINALAALTARVKDTELVEGPMGLKASLIMCLYGLAMGRLGFALTLIVHRHPSKRVVARSLLGAFASAAFIYLVLA